MCNINFIIRKIQINDYKKPKVMVVNIDDDGNLYRFVYRENEENSSWEFLWYEPVIWMEEDEYYAPLSAKHPIYIREAISIREENDKNKAHYHMILKEAKELLNHPMIKPNSILNK